MASHIAQIARGFQSLQLVDNGVGDGNGAKEVEDAEGIYFSPPIYLQRYRKVNEWLLELFNDPINKDLENGRTVMEVGCAEFGMHVFLKGIHEIGKIIYLDVDEQLLMNKKICLRPLPAEYLQKPSRPKPLVVEAYAGDITCVDTRILLENPKIWCVVAVELIEHLVEKDLKGFEQSVFGVISPEFVIVTTPNSDFNPVFKLPPGKFRHWDHKFEWSRNEFTNWCDTMCATYPQYAYITQGIGEGPPETAPLGCVSQMAIFKNVNHVSRSTMLPSVSVRPDAYKLLESIIYPNYVEFRSLDQIILEDIEYLVCNYWVTKRNIESCMENDITEIVYALKDVIKMLPSKTAQTSNLTVDYLRKVLEAANKYSIVRDENSGEYGMRIEMPLWDEEIKDEFDDDFVFDEASMADTSCNTTIETDDSWE